MRPARPYKTNMGGRVIILGRIAAVVAPGTPTYIVIGSTRIDLRADQSFSSFQVGQRVSVTAVLVDGEYVAEKIIPNARPLIGKLRRYLGLGLPCL